jgi:tRNA-binding EMAP/Myf-like protein
MSVMAVRITAARDHEAADRLRVYQVEAPGMESTQIIANKDTVYDAGDVAAAALVGTVLSDGKKIEKQKVRGVLSFGMLMGKVADGVAPGTDLTTKFGATHVEKQVDESQGVVEESNWPRYTSLDGFLRVRGEILACPDVVVSEKIHGSNFRVGFHGSRPWMVGTHTSRVVDSRLAADSWPEGHLVRKSLEWCDRLDVKGLVTTWKAKHPEVTSLSVFGEICGFKCSDLHYGTKESEVRLFGEVAVNGRFLDYDDALNVLGQIFEGRSVGSMMVPVLYRGKPDMALLKELRDRPSTLAAQRGEKQISEGVVIRPTMEAVSRVTLNRLCAKFKSPLYEERKSLRDADPDKLPVYVTAYDLLQDFVTDERIRHVLGKAEASGMTVEKKQMKDIAGLLYDDIRKESVGEWPAGESFDEGTLRRWTFNIAGEALSRLIDARSV